MPAPPSYLPPEYDRATTAAISNTLHRESRHYSAPFWWSRDPFNASSVCACASCFFVEIGDTRFGITANHVVSQFLACRAEFSSTRLVVRNLDISDWDLRFIDGSDEYDVATFRVSAAELEAIGARMFRVEPDKWPPPPPDVGRGVFITGYLDQERRVLHSKAVEFAQMSNALVATSVEDDCIEVTIDPAELRGLSNEPQPPTTKSLSGNSGAPLLVVSAKTPGPLFWLGGIVIQQMSAQSGDEPTTVWARRPDCILPSGKLRKRKHVAEDN
jgi:hypothetical protein